MSRAPGGRTRGFAGLLPERVVADAPGKLGKPMLGGRQLRLARARQTLYKPNACKPRRMRSGRSSAW